MTTIAPTLVVATTAVAMWAGCTGRKRTFACLCAALVTYGIAAVAATYGVRVDGQALVVLGLTVVGTAVLTAFVVVAVCVVAWSSDSDLKEDA